VAAVTRTVRALATSGDMTQIWTFLYLLCCPRAIRGLYLYRAVVSLRCSVPIFCTS